MEWPCPKCGCSHEVEKGLHERWGCYRDEPASDEELKAALGKMIDTVEKAAP